MFFPLFLKKKKNIHRLKIIVFLLQKILLYVEIRIVLCFLKASHCNPMVLNVQIPTFIEAFLRVQRWVMHYASMQFRHI